MRSLALAFVAAALAALSGTGSAATTDAIGSVHMPITCGAEANAGFDRGLALLHSFWYDRAESEFERVIAAHPDCAIAYWGAAMTRNHPLWSPPSGTDVRAARDYLRRAERAAGDARERRFLAAAASLYGDGDAARKHERDLAYRDAMRAMLAEYPDDETALFTALAVLGAGATYVRGADDTSAQQAVALLEPIHQRRPDHPGVLHYLIHAYDTDALAPRGLPAARAYAATAPAVPHALHMPSHITSRLGLWREAHDSNLAAWNANVAAVARDGQPGYARDFHNLMFGQYAALQLGLYAEAKRDAEIALDQYDENLRLIARGGLSDDEAAALRGADFNVLAMVAHYALDAGDYGLAARLPSAYSSPSAASFAAQVRALAAIARRDEPAMDAAAAAARAVLAAAAPKPPAVALIAAHQTLGLIAHARADEVAARAALEAAVAADEAQNRHPQPTNPALPARELYGRLLLEQGDAAGALAQYRTALTQYPNRALTLLGAARAARAAGERGAAAEYAARFLALWADADPGSPLRVEALALR